jgi:hypothetical protein
MKLQESTKFNNAQCNVEVPKRFRLLRLDAKRHDKGFFFINAQWNQSERCSILEVLSKT